MRPSPPRPGHGSRLVAAALVLGAPLGLAAADYCVTITQTAPLASGDPAILAGVFARSASDIWSVGNRRDLISGSRPTLRLHFDGSQWNEVPGPLDPYPILLTAVAAAGPVEAWAVGTGYPSPFEMTGERQRWSGSAWLPVPGPGPGAGNSLALVDVAGASASDVWAVGYRTTSVNELWIEHWDGVAWTRAAAPPLSGSSELRAVIALAADDAWAVGYQDDGQRRRLALHWDGLAWSAVPFPDPPTLPAVGLHGISALARDDIYASGGGLYHHDGSGWTLVDPEVSGALAAASPGEVYVLASNTGPETAIARWDGSKLCDVCGPRCSVEYNVLNDIAPLPGGGAVFVGGGSDLGNDCAIAGFVSPASGAPPRVGNHLLAVRVPLMAVNLDWSSAAAGAQNYAVDRVLDKMALDPLVPELHLGVSGEQWFDIPPASGIAYYEVHAAGCAGRHHPE